MVSLAAFAAPAGATQGSERGMAAVPSLEEAVIAQVNVVRRRQGLRPLRLSRGLARAATRHTVAMGQRGVFAHELPGGPRFDARLRRYYRPLGRGWSVGENLAAAWPSPTAEETVRMWLASPTHRRNMLTPRWREIGVAAISVPDAPGDFGDADITLITADFGVRK